MSKVIDLKTRTPLDDGLEELARLQRIRASLIRVQELVKDLERIAAKQKE